MTKDRIPLINESSDVKADKADWESEKQEEYDFDFLTEKKDKSQEVIEQDIRLHEQNEKALVDESNQFDYIEKRRGQKGHEKKEKNKESNESSNQEDKIDLKTKMKKEAIEEIIDVDPGVKGLKLVKKSKEIFEEEEIKRQETELGHVEHHNNDEIKFEQKQVEPGKLDKQGEEIPEIHNDQKIVLIQNREYKSVEKKEEEVDAHQLGQQQREKMLKQGEKTENHTEDDVENYDRLLEDEHQMGENFESEIVYTEESSLEQKLEHETTEEQVSGKYQESNIFKKNTNEKITPWETTKGEISSETDSKYEQRKLYVEGSDIEGQPFEANQEQSVEENIKMSYKKTNFDKGEPPKPPEVSEKKAGSFYEQMYNKTFENFRDKVDKWDELSNTERITALEDLNSKLVDFMGIKEKPTLKFVELPEDVGGSYREKTITFNIGNPEKMVVEEEIIKLNTRNLDNPRVIVTTLLHELQHAKQYQTVEAVNNVSKYSMYKPTIQNRIDYYIANPGFNNVKEWENNINNYKRPGKTEREIEEYENQPIEEDARNAEKLIDIIFNEREINQSVKIEQITIGEGIEFPSKQITQQFFQEKLQNIETIKTNGITNPHSIEYKKNQINQIWEEGCKEYQLYDAPSLDLYEFEAKFIDSEQNEVAIGKYDKNAHSIKLDGKYLSSLPSSELQVVLNEHFQEAIEKSETRRVKMLELYQNSLYENLEENQFGNLERWNEKSLVDKVISFNNLEETILEQHGVDLKIKIIKDGSIEASNVLINLEEKKISLSMEVLQNEQSVKNVIANNLAEIKMKEWTAVNSELRFEQFSKEQIERKEHLEFLQQTEVKEIEEPLDKAELFGQYKDYLDIKADVLLPQHKWDALTNEHDKKSEMTEFLQGILKEGDFDTDTIEFQRNIRSKDGNQQQDFIYKKKSREIVMERELLNEYTRDRILESFAEVLAERKIQKEKESRDRVNYVQNHYEEQIHFFLKYENDIDDEHEIGFFIDQWELYSESEKIERVHFLIEKFSNEPGIKNQPEVVFESFDNEDETFSYERYDNTIRLEASLLNNPDALIKGISRGLAKAQEREREFIEPGSSLFKEKPSLDDIRNMGEDIWYGNDRSTYNHIFDGHLDEDGSVKGLHYHGNDMINPYTKIDRVYGNSVDSENNAVNAKISITRVDHNGQSIRYIKNYSTMFPRHMSPEEVIDSVNEAYIDAKYTGKGNEWRGISSNGLSIILYLDDNNRIISAFPEI